MDPLEFLLSVMDSPDVEPNLRVRAAIAAAQYKHKKVHDGGKKDEQERAAQAAGEGKFSPAPAPLRVVGGR